MRLVRALEASKLAGVAKATIYAAIKRGDLKRAADATVILLDAEDVIRWAQTSKLSRGRQPKKRISV